MISYQTEEELQDLIIANLSRIRIDDRILTLFPNGKEFPSLAGPIDILASDGADTLYVIEVKKVGTKDLIVGQVTRYMGALKFAFPTKVIKGVLIAKSYDQNTQYAAAAVPNLILLETDKDVLPFCRKPVNIYLAGRIWQGDWREQIVPGLKILYEGDIENHDSDFFQDGKEPLLTTNGDVFIGPYFAFSHRSPYHATLSRSMKQIARCDVFFVWTGIDFEKAYGTHAEIGMAKVLNKKIILGCPPETDLSEYWFLTECADVGVENDTPSLALEEGLIKLGNLNQKCQYTSKHRRSGEQKLGSEPLVCHSTQF